MTGDGQAIRAESLSRHFGSVRAADELSFSVAEGEIYGLVGPDGAGKTTVMRLLAGILSVTSGDAWVAGHSVKDEAETIKEKIGYMSQRFGLYPDLTVMENIQFYANIFGVPARRRTERIEQLLAFSGLGQFQKRLAGNLSGGMKQKLSLSCVLIHSPRILLLDEPTCGVDPLSRRELWRILYQLRRERVTIFVSTVYLNEAERCSQIGLLHRGRLLATGTPAQVRKLATGVILELQTSDPRRAARVLRQNPLVRSADMFGDRVHAVASGLETAATIEADLAQNGITVRTVRQIEPSLEDVFVAIVRERDRHDSAQRQ